MDCSTPSFPVLHYLLELAQTHGTEQLHFHFSLSCIGEGNGNPLQCSCLENPRDGGAWWAAVHGVTQSWTWLKWLSSSSSSSMSIESVMPSNHLILCHPFFLLLSIFAGVRVFSNESALHTRWPKYWSFSFSISPSIEYSGLSWSGTSTLKSIHIGLLRITLVLYPLPQHNYYIAPLSLSTVTHFEW